MSAVCTAEMNYFEFCAPIKQNKQVPVHVLSHHARNVFRVSQLQPTIDIAYFCMELLKLYSLNGSNVFGFVGFDHISKKSHGYHLQAVPAYIGNVIVEKSTAL